jgi:hypothetical protein
MTNEQRATPVGARPCFVCGKPTRVETWRDHHTREVIAVVDWCPSCHSSKNVVEGDSR